MYDSLWQAVAPHLNAERMQADIAECFALSRWSSFDKINALARLIAAKMEEAGLCDVRLIEAPADGRTAYGGWVMPRAFDVKAARLSQVFEGSRHEVLVDYHTTPTALMLNSLSTPPGGIIAELVVADSVDACRSSALAGRLVLTSCGGVEFSHAAMRAGAVGIISDGRFGRRWFKEGAYLDETSEWHNYTIPPWDDPDKGFGFSISPNQGRELRSRLAAGETVRLHAVVESRHYDGAVHVVSGLLPGSESEEIVLTGHYDEFGADDNCSQVAVGLEVVRALRAMLQAGQLPPLRRGIRLLFPMEVRGFNALVQDHNETCNMVFGLNIDTVGTDQNAATATCTLVDSFAALPSCAEELLAELLQRLASESPLFRWRRVGPDVIDNVFGEPLIGAPTPCLYHYSATHHTTLDTPERISGRTLFDMARVAATYAGFLASAGLDEALWLAELVTDHAVQRLGAIATDGLRGDGSAERLQSLLRQTEALHDAYQQRLRSVRRLVPAVDLMPTPSAVAASGDALLGEARLLPRAAFDQATEPLCERITRARAEAEAGIRRRTKAFHSLAELTSPAPLPASRCVPLKAFRGFVAFEDCSDAERRHLSHDLGVDCSWGAPVWLQEALMWANGNRTASEIAVLLERHYGRVPDVPRLEAVFELMSQKGLVRLRPYLTRDNVGVALRQAGVSRGDAILGHFSLSRFGYIEGGAEGLIDTLLGLISAEGTLMMPTFSFSWVGHPVYDPARTPSQVGAVTDGFWSSPGVRRSRHPTHSFAAFGPLSEALLEGHDHTQPPLGEDSPIGRLAGAGGKILMFAPKQSNTSMHVGEHIAGLPQVDLVCPVLLDGSRHEVVVPRCPWHVAFDRAYERLYVRDQVCDVPLGESVLHTMRCRDAIAAQTEVARETPAALIQPGCDCQYCRNLQQYSDERG